MPSPFIPRLMHILPPSPPLRSAQPSALLQLLLLFETMMSLHSSQSGSMINMQMEL